MDIRNRIARSALPVLAVLSLPAAGAEGIYDRVDIRDSEVHLLESSAELLGYFNEHALLHDDQALLEFVRAIGHDLAPAPTDSYIDYEFFVLRDPSPNAFALPNGHVYLHTGMLARMDDEAQLAGLLAHEINHVAGHHSIVDFRSRKKKTIASMVLGGLGGWGSIIATGLYTSVYGFTRDLEQEADNKAVPILAGSRYDPHAMPEIFEILSTDYEGLNPRIPTIWSTHPQLEERAVTSRVLMRNLPERKREVETFRALVFPLRTLTIRDYIQDDYPHTALALSRSLLERQPGNPDLMLTLGDAWQALGARSEFATQNLTDAEKRRNARDRVRYTREQREAELLETAEGRANLEHNLGEAQRVYEQILEQSPDYAGAHRGLGQVHERREEYRSAARAYLRYVELAPLAPDRSIITRRLQLLADRLRREDER